jgi:hypothetical protein
MQGVDPVALFEASMVMDVEKWRDGLGYDVHLISDMNEVERLRVENLILGRGVSDWRDLEALDALATPRALEAIRTAQSSGNAELRLWAARYGPPSTDLSATVVAALQAAEPFGGLSNALSMAVANPSDDVKQTLLRMANERTGAAAYGAAAALYEINGLIEDHNGFERRDFFLRLTEPGPDKDAALLEMREELGQQHQGS